MLYGQIGIIGLSALKVVAPMEFTAAVEHVAQKVNMVEECATRIRTAMVQLLAVLMSCVQVCSMKSFPDRKARQRKRLPYALEVRMKLWYHRE